MYGGIYVPNFLLFFIAHLRRRKIKIIKNLAHTCHRTSDLVQSFCHRKLKTTKYLQFLLTFCYVFSEFLAR